MRIEINITDDRVSLVLENKGDIIDEISWTEKNNLSQKLILEIDNLLNKNELKPSDIEKMEVETGISEKFTTVRIAKVVAKTFNFSNKK